MSKSLAVVCDSTADFPPGMAAQLGLHILPVHIIVEKKDHLHGQTITNKEVVKNLKKKKQVYTTPFYPYECTKLFDSLLQHHDEVVSLHLSKEISGNYKSACAARKFMGKTDSQRVHILDLGSVSISLSLLVKKAVALLNEGIPPENLQKHLAPYQENVFMAFTVENLVWLKKGGRVNAFEAFVGNMLNIKPIIQLREARLEPVERHRGKKSAVSHLVSLAQQNHEKFKNCEIWMAYADNLEEIMVAREKLAAAIGKPSESILLAEVGATISVHTGPGSIAIAMLPQKTANKDA